MRAFQKSEAGGGRGRSRTPRGARVCPDCAREGRRMPVQNASWCHGFCKRHARMRSFSEPSRVTPARSSPSREGRRARAQCSDCLAEGVTMFAHSKAWCGGFCKCHVRAHSLSEPSRTTSARRSLGVGKKSTRRIPRLRLRSKQTVHALRRSSPSREGRRARAQCPDCLGAGVAMFARSEAWCGGFCKRHARAHGLSEPGRTTSARRSPAVGEELTRRIPRVHLGSKRTALPFQRHARCQQAPCP